MRNALLVRCQLQAPSAPTECETGLVCGSAQCRRGPCRRSPSRRVLVSPPERHPSPPLKHPRQIIATLPQAGSDRVPACLFPRTTTTSLTDLPLAVPRRRRPPWQHLIQAVSIESSIPSIPGLCTKPCSCSSWYLSTPVFPRVLGVPVPRPPPPSIFQFRLRRPRSRPWWPALPMRSGPGLQLLEATPPVIEPHVPGPPTGHCCRR